MDDDDSCHDDSISAYLFSRPIQTSVSLSRYILLGGSVPVFFFLSFFLSFLCWLVRDVSGGGENRTPASRAVNLWAQN